MSPSPVELAQPRLALVTGANGFIGAHVCRTLLAQGIPTRAMVLAGTPAETLKGMDLEIVPADITLAATLPPALKGVSHVFHLAALATDWAPMAAFQRVIHGGTIQMLLASAEAGVQRFVHTSSLAIHAYRGHNGSDETAPLDSTLNGYALAKIDAEKSVRLFHRPGGRLGMETVIIRPGLMPYGPGDTTSFFPMATAIEKGFFGLVNGGRARLCTAYVENLTQGMVLAGRHPAAGGETFILADDEPISWREIAHDVAVGLGVKPPRFSLPYWALWPVVGGMEAIGRATGWKNPPLTFYRIAVVRKDLVFSNRKAKEQIGFQPKIGLKEGLERTLAWYREARRDRKG